MATGHGRSGRKPVVGKVEADTTYYQIPTALAERLQPVVEAFADVLPPDRSVAGKYAGLAKLLSWETAPEVELPFRRLDEVVSGKLPPSARTLKAWWANTLTHVQGKAWLSAGWRVASLDLNAEKVRFSRV